VYREGDKKISFKRNISAEKGSSSYFLDEKQVTAEDYNRALNKINIFPKLKNFLIFQGSVTSVASKSPKEITEIIEKISGSADLKQAYEEAKLKEKELKDSTMFQYQKKRGMI
jgi:structural maintenance of chromosome 1